jgi:hypothetical protein
MLADVNSRDSWRSAGKDGTLNVGGVEGCVKPKTQCKLTLGVRLTNEGPRPWRSWGHIQNQTTLYPITAERYKWEGW